MATRDDRRTGVAATRRTPVPRQIQRRAVTLTAVSDPAEHPADEAAAETTALETATETATVAPSKRPAPSAPRTRRRPGLRPAGPRDAEPAPDPAADPADETDDAVSVGVGGAETGDAETGDAETEDGGAAGGAPPRRRPRPRPARRPRTAAPAAGDTAEAEDVAEAEVAEAEVAEAEAGADAGAGRWRLLTVALAVVLLAGLVATGLFARRWYDQSQLAAARDGAVAAARQTTVNFVSISASTVDRDLQRIADGATGDFKDEFTKDQDQVKSAVATNKVDSKGTVLRAAVVSANRHTVVVLLAVDATVKNTSAPDGRLSHYRIEVTMSRDAHSGRWLVAQLQFVG